MANAAPLNPSPATTNQQISCVVDGVSVAPQGIHGWSLIEHTGTTKAIVHLHDGTSTAGPIVAEIELVAGGESQVLNEDAIALVSGAIFLEVVSGGSVEGDVFWT